MNIRNLYSIVILAFIILVQSNSLMAQDIHFTQFFNSPSTLNPAMTGFSPSRLRFNLNHRNQWGVVSTPFQTYNANLDAQIIKRKTKGDALAIGVSALSDKAGDSEFGTQQVSASLAYFFALNNSNRNILSFGFQYSLAQRSINYQELLFDEQYNGNQFDPNITPTENFAINNFSYQDYAAGIAWYTMVGYDLSFRSGLGVYHINRTQVSFKNDESLRMPIKWVLHSEAHWIVNSEYQIIPAIMIAQQRSNTEILLGGRYKYLSSDKNGLSSFSLGAYYRNKDAIALYVELGYKQMELGISYDFNISKLKIASRYLGGIEVGFLWQLSPNRKPRVKDLPCPIF